MLRMNSSDGLPIQNIMLENYKCVIDNDITCLEEIDDQSDDLCRYALNKNIKALQYIKNQSNILCRFAINKDIKALQYIRDQTIEICKYAIYKNTRALEYIKEHTDELCIYALELDVVVALEYINNFSHTVCEKIVDIDPMLINYIENQSEDICILAVIKNPLALKYINNKTNTICRIAIEQDYRCLQYIDQYDDSNINFINEICIEATLQNSFAIIFIRNLTQELCELAIDGTSDVYIVYYIRNQTSEICKISLNKFGPSALQYIRNPDITLFRHAFSIDIEETLKYVNIEDDGINMLIRELLDINSESNAVFKAIFDKDKLKYKPECPILRENTSEGGYIVKNHLTYEGNICSPKEVLSEEAFIELQKNKRCYICRNIIKLIDYSFLSHF